MGTEAMRLGSQNRLGTGPGAPGSALYLLVSLTLATPTLGQSASRDLSGFSDAGVTFTVTLSITEPPSTLLLGVEDAPPAGWVVSNISDTGTFDGGTGKVKWLFFDPPFPAQLTYDVTPPADDVGTRCFNGSATFDTTELRIDGDQCLDVAVPTLSQWGVMAMGLLLLSVATLTLRRDQTRGLDSCVPG